MNTSRYSEAEMDQWHNACPNCAAPQTPARQSGKTKSMAKGQAEQTMSPTAAGTASQGSAPKHDGWASECLFDCYNG